MKNDQLQLLPNSDSPVDYRKSCTLTIVSDLTKAYKAGKLGGDEHEVYPDIDKNTSEWRVYFTLPCAINYQRKSENLWVAAKETFLDPATRFVFDCSSTESYTEDQYKQALVKHKLALQQNKHTGIWYTVSKTLYNSGGDPLGFFDRHDRDVAKIKDFVNLNKKSFPYIGGPKLLNYWLYIYDHYNPGHLNGRDGISVIPDVHVKRASVLLGVVSEEESADTTYVEKAWEPVLAGSGISPCDIHAPLWRWSRAGFPALEDL